MPVSEPKRKRLNAWAEVDKTTWGRIRRWAARHLVPNSRILKRLLKVIPWWVDDETGVYLSIRKSLINDPVALRAALHEAADLAADRLLEG